MITKTSQPLSREDASALVLAFAIHTLFSWLQCLDFTLRLRSVICVRHELKFDAAETTGSEAWLAVDSMASTYM